MKRLLLTYLLLTSFTIMTFPAVSDWVNMIPFSHGDLEVDCSKRYLQHEDGTPFLYLGDTAWEMFARLSREEAERYLENRRLKGFTVIQSVILTELDDFSTISGTPQLTDETDITLSADYLNHVDHILQMAASKGLYVALLPTWGDKVDKQWGRGPELFNVKNAREYGRFLGARYVSYPNIIWVIGGDRSGGEKNRDIWKAMAEGIREKDSRHLMTYHPHGEHSSSIWFHDETWLDFNMFQSGHCQESYEIYRRLLFPDLSQEPRKPVMDGEPRYEDIPRNFRLEDGRFTAYDVRKSLYQSMLSGACGYTYGCNNVWQMYTAKHIPMCEARIPWYDSLDLEGAGQLIYFRRLWNMFSFKNGKTFFGMISTVKDGADEAVAFGGNDYLVCYFPENGRWKLNLKDWGADCYSLRWMNPRNGLMFEGGIDSRVNLEINTPDNGEKEDWVLILEK